MKFCRGCHYQTFEKCNIIHDLRSVVNVFSSASGKMYFKSFLSAKLESLVLTRTKTYRCTQKLDYQCSIHNDNTTTA